MRRRGPEPPPEPPQIQLKPGLAQETLRELAPLLAEEGIDVDNIDVPDLATLQAAMNRAVERHNMTRFTPVGHARDLAVTTLRLVIEALADGDTALAAAILEHVQPDSPDNTTATVAGCTGVALGLLDDWLTGTEPHAPPASASASGCQPGTGSASAPPPTSWSWPARDAPSPRSAPSSPGKAASTSSTAAPSPSPPPPRPGQPAPAQRSTTSRAPRSAEDQYHSPNQSRVATMTGIRAC